VWRWRRFRTRSPRTAAFCTCATRTGRNTPLASSSPWPASSCSTLSRSVSSPTATAPCHWHSVVEHALAPASPAEHRQVLVTMETENRFVLVLPIDFDYSLSSSSSSSLLIVTYIYRLMVGRRVKTAGCSHAAGESLLVVVILTLVSVVIYIKVEPGFRV